MEYFRRLEPGEKPTPPPGWLAEFTTQTLSGFCGGLAWGGYQGLVEARSTGVTNRPKERAAAYFVRGALTGGARIGGFVMLFSGLAIACEHTRGSRDAANYSAAAATTALAFAAPIGLARAVRPIVAAGVGGAVLGGIQVELERYAGGKLFEVVHLQHLDDDDERPVPIADVVSDMENHLAVSTNFRTATDLGLSGKISDAHE